jgi:hypothetical protein
MKRLYVALCALFLGAGCTSDCAKGKSEDFWKGWWPDDMMMKSDYVGAQKTLDADKAPREKNP